MKLPLFLSCLADSRVIETSYRFACFGAIAAAALAAFALAVEWRHARVVWWPLYAPLVAVHPGWSMWPSFLSSIRLVSSDCGYTDRFLSMAICVAVAAILLCVVFRPDVSRRMFIGVLALACWQVYLGVRAWWYSPTVFGWLTQPLGHDTTVAISFGGRALFTPAVVFTMMFLALSFLRYARRRAYRFTLFAAAVITALYSSSAHTQYVVARLYPDGAAWELVWLCCIIAVTLLLVLEGFRMALFDRWANAV